MKRYIIKQPNHDLNTKVGEPMYEFLHHDYGSSSTDSGMLGEPCVSVTRNPEGDHPFITLPERQLQRIHETHPN